MAENRRKIQTEQPVTRRQIGMADTAGGDSDENLIVPGVIDLNVPELELGARIGHNGRATPDLHDNLLLLFVAPVEKIAAGGTGKILYNLPDSVCETKTNQLEKVLKETTAQATGPHKFEMTDWISCAPYEKLLNMTIADAADGKARLTMPFLVDYAQGAGLLHGGALVSLADTAVVMAIKSIISPMSHFATIELGCRFILPVKKGIVTAEAEVLSKEGRQLKGRATVYDEEGRVVLEFWSTFKIARDARIRAITFKNSEDGRQRTEDRKPKTEDGRRNTED
jgi:uncharacterized protein (TIGR00369 family)